MGSSTPTRAAPGPGTKPQIGPLIHRVPSIFSAAWTATPESRSRSADSLAERSSFQLFDHHGRVCPSGPPLGVIMTDERKVPQHRSHRPFQGVSRSRSASISLFSFSISFRQGASKSVPLIMCLTVPPATISQRTISLMPIICLRQQLQITRPKKRESNIPCQIS